MAARTPPRCTFLYVDEDAAAIAVARGVLEGRDLVLALAPNLERALVVARRKPPEVMLINMDLTSLGAKSLIYILRANPGLQTAPLLCLGLDSAPEAAARAREVGFFQYLLRPLDAGQLTDALDFALEFSALERAEL
jgi:putative two-component system response regulator